MASPVSETTSPIPPKMAATSAAVAPKPRRCRGRTVPECRFERGPSRHASGSVDTREMVSPVLGGLTPVSGRSCLSQSPPGVQPQPPGDLQRPQKRHIVTDHEERTAVTGQRGSELLDRG